MKWLKKLSLLLVCFALITGGIAGVANASCCVSMTDIQMEDGNMPCHNDDAGVAVNDCDGCGCSHCIPIQVSLPSLSMNNPSLSGAVVVPLQSYFTFSAQGHFQPPRNIS